ncbi:DUF2442 domain-containing protein [Telmatospirillum sp. J64-1]|uniref:DUF2442 domain-containing protein n=1 Tax=Telmatospirillum sp. J64-1 TaxID=2502183 RepID=UPI00115DD9AD|nr:DUF2442 domain-containing protein [Telmatospirillum sp. J64-1]
MLKDVVSVEVLEGTSLHIRFEDGVEGLVDVADLVPFEGVFAPLKEPEVFAQASVSTDLGTVCWPGGADLDPGVLYSRLTGHALPRRPA